jgi:MoxR-like ATPase
MFGIRTLTESENNGKSRLNICSMSVSALNDRIKADSMSIDAIVEQVAKIFIRQKYIIERLIVGSLCNGHILIEGVPGLAKTTTVQALSNAIAASFRRLQFTSHPTSCPRI